MKGAAHQRREVEGESAQCAQPALAVLSGNPEPRVQGDLPVLPAVTDAELEVIERHLRGMLQQVLFDEKSEANGFSYSRGALRPCVDHPPG